MALSLRSTFLALSKKQLLIHCVTRNKVAWNKRMIPVKHVDVIKSNVNYAFLLLSSIYLMVKIGWVNLYAAYPLL